MRCELANNKQCSIVSCGHHAEHSRQPECQKSCAVGGVCKAVITESWDTYIFRLGREALENEKDLFVVLK